MRHACAMPRLMMLLAATMLLAAPLSAQQKQGYTNLTDALRASGILSGRSGPASVNWIEGGESFSYTTRNPATNREEIRRYDPESLSDQLLLDAHELTLPGTEDPFEYRSFQWAQDSEHLIFQTDFRPIYRSSGVSDYYVYSLADETLQLAADDARTAELSPDGSMLGYERGGNLYVYDLDAERESQLTTGATDSVFNGVFDWVYEEEFGQTQAWRWSHDSRYIAFWQTDESEVPLVRITDWEGQHPDWVTIPIPKPGDPNPEVRIGVSNVESGDITWLDIGTTEEHYIPRIYWTNDPNTLAVVTLNRPQTRVRLYFFDVRDGERRLVFEERADAWIDVFDFYAGIDDFFSFPEGRDEFFWLSYRDGNQHVYRYDYDGDLLNQVTSGDWNVTRVEAIDPERELVYYTSTEVSPLERHLYVIGFDAEGKQRLSEASGTHRFNMSPNARYYIDNYSSASQPRRVELWSTDGERLAVLEDNAQTHEWLETHAYSPVELFSFTTSDGVEIDASMIKPPDFDPSQQYPVLMSIYGGPGSQQVYNAFASNGWHQYLAQQGYIVVGVNNRGTGNYDREFMKVVYRQLGRWESHDFVEAAQYLASLPYVDGSRMAIQGTSYGGYATLYTMLAHPGVFQLGIANSPVTDWKLYDTIYTERYMDLLPENEAGYRSSSVIAKAGQLEGELLLVHSGMDDNVHPNNTMQFITALTNAGKDADLRFYPPGAHGAAYNFASYILMTQVYTNRLCAELHADDCEVVELN